MPRLPFGLGQDVLRRVKERIEREVGPDPLGRVKERLKTELGLTPKERPPARSSGEIIFRIREAAGQRPPKLVRALYKAKDANVATWRYLAPYELVYDRKKDRPSEPLLYAACEKDGWKTECFWLDRFEDVQVTDIPFPAFIPYSSKISR
jgi:hypothetical protein